MIKSAALTLLAYVFTTVAAYATCGANACTGKVKDVWAVQDGKTYIVLDEPTSELDKLNCVVEAPASGGRFLLSDDQTVGADAMLSVLLTASTQDKALRVRVLEGTDPCKVSYLDLSFN
ncbi:MAG: hypothetical protein AAGC77_12000 [Pseudomonadota bacterium]